MLLGLNALATLKAQRFFAFNLLRMEMDTHLRTDVAVNGKLKEETMCSKPSAGLKIIPMTLEWEKEVTCRFCKSAIYSCLDEGNPR